MRRKFKILDENGKVFKPEGKMLAMNSDGVFFTIKMDSSYHIIQLLSKVLPKYDVVWRGEYGNYTV